MKQSLQLKLGQQLTMTPQLQQAIRLLQLSTMDLQQEIQEALDSNPLLEVLEDNTADTEDSQADALENTVDESTPQQQEEQTSSGNTEDGTDWAANELNESSTLPEDLAVDVQWDDLLPSASAPPPPDDDYTDSDVASRSSANESLREKLLWQLGLTRLSDTDRLIALSIIDATDANGRLLSSVEEIHVQM